MMADSGRRAYAFGARHHCPTAAGSVEPAIQPFHKPDNVLTTRHVSGWAQGMLRVRLQVIAENIPRTATDEPPLDLIAPSP